MYKLLTLCVMNRENIRERVLDLLKYLEPDMYQRYDEGYESDKYLYSISLADDLGLNVLDVADLGIDIQKIFNTEVDDEITKCETIGDLISYVSMKLEKTR